MSIVGHKLEQVRKAAETSKISKKSYNAFSARIDDIETRHLRDDAYGVGPMRERELVDELARIESEIAVEGRSVVDEVEGEGRLITVEVPAVVAEADVVAWLNGHRAVLPDVSGGADYYAAVDAAAVFYYNEWKNDGHQAAVDYKMPGIRALMPAPVVFGEADVVNWLDTKNGGYGANGGPNYYRAVDRAAALYYNQWIVAGKDPGNAAAMPEIDKIAAVDVGKVIDFLDETYKAAPLVGDAVDEDLIVGIDSAATMLLDNSDTCDELTMIAGEIHRLRNDFFNGIIKLVNMTYDIKIDPLNVENIKENMKNNVNHKDYSYKYFTTEKNTFPHISDVNLDFDAKSFYDGFITDMKCAIELSHGIGYFWGVLKMYYTKYKLAGAPVLTDKNSTLHSYFENMITIIRNGVLFIQNRDANGKMIKINKKNVVGIEHSMINPEFIDNLFDLFQLIVFSLDVGGNRINNAKVQRISRSWHKLIGEWSLGNKIGDRKKTIYLITDFYTFFTNRDFPQLSEYEYKDVEIRSILDTIKFFIYIIGTDEGSLKTSEHIFEGSVSKTGKFIPKLKHYWGENSIVIGGVRSLFDTIPFGAIFLVVIIVLLMNYAYQVYYNVPVPLLYR